MSLAEQIAAALAAIPGFGGNSNDPNPNSEQNAPAPDPAPTPTPDPTPTTTPPENEGTESTVPDPQGTDPSPTPEPQPNVVVLQMPTIANPPEARTMYSPEEINRMSLSEIEAAYTDPNTAPLMERTFREAQADFIREGFKDLQTVN